MGKRYVFLSLRLSHWQNATASFQVTLTTGWSSVCGKPVLCQLYLGSRSSHMPVWALYPQPPVPKRARSARSSSLRTGPVHSASVGVARLRDEFFELADRDVALAHVEGLGDPHQVPRVFVLEEVTGLGLDLVGGKALQQYLRRLGSCPS